MDEESNRVDAEQDFALLRDCNNDISMFRQRKCKQEIVSLCHNYGTGAVRRALAKVTTGAPRKRNERCFQVWLAVELFRFYNKGIDVKGACDGVALFFRRKTKEPFKFPSGDLRRDYYRVRQRLGELPYLPQLLQIHINCPCVVRSGPEPCSPTFENTIEFALGDLRI